MRIERARSGLRFAGYASVFDRVDRGGDIVRAGAFRQTLEKRGKVPLLWQHQPGRQVGAIEHLAEDARGLQVIGKTATTTCSGACWRANCRKGGCPASASVTG